MRGYIADARRILSVSGFRREVDLIVRTGEEESAPADEDPSTNKKRKLFCIRRLRLIAACATNDASHTVAFRIAGVLVGNAAAPAIQRRQRRSRVCRRSFSIGVCLLQMDSGHNIPIPSPGDRHLRFVIGKGEDAFFRR
jgi:hypothetical protein